MSKNPVMVEAGKKAWVTRRNNMKKLIRREAAYRAHETMKERYGENYAVENAKKAAITRKNNKSS